MGKGADANNAKSSVIYAKKILKRKNWSAEMAIVLSNLFQIVALRNNPCQAVPTTFLKVANLIEKRES
jgi:hypothetical protein